VVLVCMKKDLREASKLTIVVIGTITKFSLSVKLDSRDVLVMGCKSPLATPRAISTSRSLVLVRSHWVFTLQYRPVTHPSRAVLVRST